ncbi:conserved Plasmodium protein, unknown function [Plasmodium knowlesi strain H]|uniref:Uncharacterized protein n=3 Tax=Plasmodium knowlesi TaxID=5850 RepID=A0A5K1VJS6_PLAKH|nr:conserved Plasmodium protein, unknown function [Plasmodium knowlesi strain H]OTN64986.1 Uncharacterized protein PKNOH_S120147700 [Plasmodium knowlesi]CAA9988334.1 conserved Plasmodium protein, unknown function [Plasmodium knowlesi strain H]SBO20130.1 conserved Plasmodium protein, unknown function [Plasmodium knowlesi strain H]SBO20287.1 conserved Plasmodium protein, unknown function [Plasmodium knowlesi strain H]VVS77808.1 conserved Plasmodium protein, unknown function [Plasmodium knowlesi |eukprot:XP_002259313.1 hypothetical protein, conserved in Plasmodium species [Plasmodium knowlesi strain H]
MKRILLRRVASSVPPACADISSWRPHPPRGENAEKGKPWEGGKVIRKNCLAQHEEDVINSIQNRIPKQDRLIANKITQVLQHYSVYNYRNEHVIQVIRSYVKHNVDRLSLIRLCVYVNYFLNLKVKGERNFNYIITNCLIKKIKNDEFVDLHGLCLIAKFILRERVKDGELLRLLESLVKNKVDATSSSFDVYNLAVSLLSIQSEGLLRGGEAATQGRTKVSMQSNPELYYTQASAHPPDGVIQLNEENVYTLLQLYLKAEKVKNEELLLIINTLSTMDRMAFFYQMNLTKCQRLQLYEALLTRVNFQDRFSGKVLSLFLFNLKKMIRLGEISEGIFYSTVMNLGSAVREAAVETKLQVMQDVNYNSEISREREKNELVAEGVEVKTVNVTNGLNDHLVRKKATQGEQPQLRAHFNLQEVGMVLQFYDALVKVTQWKKSNIWCNLQPARHIESEQNCQNIYDEEVGDVTLQMEKRTGKEGAVRVDDTHVNTSIEEKTHLRTMYDPIVRLLKESLLFYAQGNYGRKVKMNALDFCTLLKGFSKVFQNTFLDRNIFNIFQNFLMYNSKKIKINELQIILKLIFEKRKFDFFLILCSGRNCSIFEHLQSVLLRTVLSESPHWSNQGKIEECIMCFYYLSFLNFNPNTYLVVNQFIMDHMTCTSAIPLMPYIIISKFNYHMLEMRAIKKMEFFQVEEAVENNNKDLLAERKQITNNFEKMDKLYQLINRHFEMYKTFFVLNCIYALTKFLKDNRTSGFPPFSNFSFPQLFNKLSHRLLMKNALGTHQHGDHIPTHYDYFVNYVKYNYCLLFLLQYVDLCIFLQRIPLGVEFPFSFYTPFNAYLTAEFLVNYERLLRSGHFTPPQEFSENTNEATGSVMATDTPAFTREVMNSRWREIQMEKKKMLKNVTRYASSHCNVMSVHDLIHLIKTFKVMAPLIDSGNLSTLRTSMSNLTFAGNVKTSTSFELLTELIKFMYHFELQNGEVFADCHGTIVDMLILAFRIVFKNLPDRTDNNYLGMLQFSLLYVSHFVRGANLVFNSLSLTDLKRADYMTNLSPMNLDKYPQSSCTFQIQILKVLKGVVKNEKRILNEYRVGDTPYTVDILIT